MDFQYHYTPEQETFRQEVRAWLEENAPRDVSNPIDPKHFDVVSWRKVKRFREQLGEKGWLHPTYPAEYGGGGLTPEHEMVIREEIEALDVPALTNRLFTDNPLDLPALLVWGDEDQKQRILRPRLEGKILGWQLFTEPEAGSDLAALKTRAVKDGDDWVISGEKVFVGSDTGYDDPDIKVPDEEQLRQSHMFCLAVTDPEAPRHQNMGYFIIPGDTPGISVRTLDLLIGHGKRQVYLDNVRVPSWRLIAEPGKGWQVAQSTLEVEHGGQGQVTHRDRDVERLIDFVRERGLDKDPRIQELVAEAVIESEITRLFTVRNYWMSTTHQPMSYHGSQFSGWRKESNVRISDIIREVMGPYALLDYRDPVAPADGLFEVHQRESLGAVHPGGTVEVQKLIVARRLGVSKTREVAAQTRAAT